MEDPLVYGPEMFDYFIKIRKSTDSVIITRGLLFCFLFPNDLAVKFESRKALTSGEVRHKDNKWRPEG